jgi:prevent-host-death family protein
MYIQIMASRYSIAEARAQLSSIIDQAESGVPVTLTRRGEPVAVLISTQEFDRLRGQQFHFGDAYRQFLTKVKLKEVGLESKFASTIRDRSTGRDVSL